MSINGHRAFVVRRSSAFQEKLDQRSRFHPRLDRVIEGIEWGLAVNPRFNARNVTGDVWVVESPRDIEAPLLWIYFTIKNRDVLLRHYEIVSDWEGPNEPT